jgi:hypothetical protein
MKFWCCQRILDNKLIELIELVDNDGACGDELRTIVYDVFNVEN